MFVHFYVKILLVFHLERWAKSASFILLPFCFERLFLGLVQLLLGQWGLCVIAAQRSAGLCDGEWADKNSLFRRKRDCRNLWTISRVVYY